MVPRVVPCIAHSGPSASQHEITSHEIAWFGMPACKRATQSNLPVNALEEGARLLSPCMGSYKQPRKQHASGTLENRLVTGLPHSTIDKLRG